MVVTLPRLPMLLNLLAAPRDLPARLHRAISPHASPHDPPPASPHDPPPASPHGSTARLPARINFAGVDENGRSGIGVTERDKFIHAIPLVIELIPR